MKPKERIHYAPERIEKLDLAKRYDPRHDGFKPHGLWYSAPCNGDGWEDWCKAENFSVRRLEFRHALEVNLDRMVVLRNDGEIMEFHERFAIDPPWRSKFIDEILPPVPRDGAIKFDYIDWAAVRERYAGIEIAPYSYSLRMDLMWYYGWDCASGCVWDLSAITDWRALS